MGVVFGLAKYKGVAAGVSLQRVVYGETGQSAEAIGEDGNIEQTNIYGKKRTIQCEGNVQDGNAAAFTVGGTLTVDGHTFTIDNVSITESVNGHKTISISGSAPMAAATPAGS